MSEWKDKSDFEINKDVAAIDPRFKSCIELEFFNNEYDSRSADVISQGIHMCTVDYCNNPSDSWDIIVKNKISISHDIVRYSANSLVYDKRFENGFKLFNYNGEIVDTSSRAALRAAMIVFLEMNGVKP